MRHNVFIGIDVGKDGGVVCISEHGVILTKRTIPKIGDKVDYKLIFLHLLHYKNFDVTVAIEDVHGFVGASTKATFNFGHIAGVKLGMTEALSVLYDYRYVMVQPKEWQSAIWKNCDKVYKPKKPKQRTRRVDPKKTSLMAAKRLFPNVDFRRTEKCKNEHDGLVDAALIALYVRKEFG